MRRKKHFKISDVNTAIDGNNTLSIYVNGNLAKQVPNSTDDLQNVLSILEKEGYACDNLKNETSGAVLTEKDKAYVCELGYKPMSFSKIEKAIRLITFTLADEDFRKPERVISSGHARRILGSKKFIWCIVHCIEKGYALTDCGEEEPTKVLHFDGTGIIKREILADERNRRIKLC